MIKNIAVLTILLCSIAGGAWANADLDKKAKKPSQEQLDEQELEAIYGVEVERDRLGGSSTSTTTRDRYGDGRVTVFQDNTKSNQNIETNDTIGVELKLFEFGK